MSRKQTPDIMEGLMGSGKLEKNKASNKVLKQESSTMQAAHKIQPEVTSHIAIEPASNKTIVDIQKEKTTFNISLATLDLLEDAWVKLRKRFKGEQRITKTLIVERAIEIVLADLDAKSELSDLYKSLKS